MGGFLAEISCLLGVCLLLAASIVSFHLYDGVKQKDPTKENTWKTWSFVNLVLSALAFAFMFGFLTDWILFFIFATGMSTAFAGVQGGAARYYGCFESEFIGSKTIRDAEEDRKYAISGMVLGWASLVFVLTLAAIRRYNPAVVRP